MKVYGGDGWAVDVIPFVKTYTPPNFKLIINFYLCCFSSIARLQTYLVFCVVIIRTFSTKHYQKRNIENKWNKTDYSSNFTKNDV